MKMKNGMKKWMVAAIFAMIVSVQANASVRSKTIIVDLPSDLPELAQGRSVAMYLHHTHAAQAILYLEKDQGRKLAILDVTDPAHIEAVGQVSVAAPATYDFVQYLGNSTVLIHYRDHSGFATISFKNYKEPVLTAEPEYLHPTRVQPDGAGALLLVSAHSTTTSAPTRESQYYEVLSVSGSSGPTPLATVKGVIQRVDRPGTGTIFLLNEQGVTVVRSLAAEEEHQLEIWEKERN
jgi:hypothetical protein